MTPWELNIPESEAVRKKNTNTIIVPHMPPSSGRIKDFRKLETDFIRSSVTGAA
jgi:hypothetical protein